MDRSKLIHETKEILRSYAIQPKKSFGQNFCVEPDLLNLIITTCKEVKPNNILEVGGGLGTLSELLSKLDTNLTIVEKDDNLAFLLTKKFQSDSTKVINEDILEQGDEFFTNFDLIIGNIPYEISSPLLFKIWRSGKESKKKPDILFTVQKEFAIRLSAKSGTQDYGRLTAMTQIHATPKILKIYPPSAFYPVPKIAHAVIWLHPHSEIEESAYYQDFSEFMIALFNRKNKQALNSLSPALKHKNKKEIVQKLRSNSLFLKRVKDLTPLECLAMFSVWKSV